MATHDPYDPAEGRSVRQLAARRAYVSLRPDPIRIRADQPPRWRLLMVWVLLVLWGWLGVIGLVAVLRWAVSLHG